MDGHTSAAFLLGKQQRSRTVQLLAENWGGTALSKFGIQTQASVAMLTQPKWLSQISSRLVQHQRLLMLMGECVQAPVDQASGINPGPDEHLLTAWMETEPTPTHGNGSLQLNQQVNYPEAECVVSIIRRPSNHWDNGLAPSKLRYHSAFFSGICWSLKKTIYLLEVLGHHAMCIRKPVTSHSQCEEGYK